MLLLPLESVGRTGRLTWRKRKAARSKILGTNGQDLDQHGGEVEWPGGGGVCFGTGLKLGFGRGEQGGVGTGILFG